jgi:hypothetical protein
MDNKDIQESLKPLFRAQELQRRDARNQVILNHIALTEEKLTPEEERIHKLAIRKLKPSYWKNLWNAILGK